MSKDDELITADEARSRGYRYTQVGWNHRENKPLVWPLHWAAAFSRGGKLSVKTLDRIAWLVDDPIPAGDIPMERA